jgi:hypothetical protein
MSSVLTLIFFIFLASAYHVFGYVTDQTFLHTTLTIFTFPLSIPIWAIIVICKKHQKTFPSILLLISYLTICLISA